MTATPTLADDPVLESVVAIYTAGMRAGEVACQVRRRLENTYAPALLDRAEEMAMDIHLAEIEAGTDTGDHGGDSEAVVLPEVPLPGPGQTITDTAAVLGYLIGKTGRIYARGGAIVKLLIEDGEAPRFTDAKPAGLASEFESVARIGKQSDGGFSARPCPEATARLIAESAAFRDALPPVKVLTACPVLIERNGRLVPIVGYDRPTGIMAGGVGVADIALDDARALLSDILSDFRFASKADRARALAAIITPALVFGGLLKGRAPVDLGEADQSQTGKGYRNRLTSAVYAQTARVVTQSKRGVGSLEESLNAALIRGAVFICLDNVRGRVDSPAFESLLTEDHFSARAAFTPNVDIDPRRVCVMMTSNKADVTTDLANRCSCVRLLKREGCEFRRYPEGDILEHVRANQPRYLGAVFAIVRAWHEAGKPHTSETRHDFRPWAQTLDWITQNLLDAGPLLDGHDEVKARMTNPVMGWLRDVALEVIRARQSGGWLRAGDVVDLLAETATETPGLPEHGDLTDAETRKAAQQSTGRRLSICFRAGETITMDGMTIERRESYDSEARYTVREYRFTAAADESDLSAAKSADGDDAEAPRDGQRPENGELRLMCGCCASDDSTDETPAAADAANEGATRESKNSKPLNIRPIESISRIAATAASEVAADREDLLSAGCEWLEQATQ